MERHEHHARRHAVAEGAPAAVSCRAGWRSAPLAFAECHTSLGIGGVDLDERPRLAAHQLVRLRRARQRVPVGVEPAGRQHERELVIGHFARLAVVARQKHGPAVRRRKATVEVAPLRAGMVRRWAGPLQSSSRAAAVRWSCRPCRTAGPRSGRCTRPRPRPRSAKSKPVWPSVGAKRAMISQSGSASPGGSNSLRTIADHALAVGAGPLLLAPLGRGQQHVGEACRLGRVVGVLHDDQLRRAQAPAGRGAGRAG